MPRPYDVFQSNRLETDSSLAVREMASPIRSDMVIIRILGADATDEEGWMESVVTSSFKVELAIRAAAPPDKTPWVI